jgi:hypothetical protein
MVRLGVIVLAIYHLHTKIIGRKAGRSAVAAAAYRAAEKIRNDYDGITHDYSRKSGVAHTEILLPESAPLEFTSRAALWNAVEQAEKRRDAQTAREIDVALPIEFDRKEQIEIMREYIQENFIARGMCADFAIHDKGDGNPHCHIMLSTRHVTPQGFGGKNRGWNDKSLLESWREKWADVCNGKFKRKGLEIRIDSRTLEAQGIGREPTIHVGLSAERKRENAKIVKRNELLTPENIAEYIHELKQGYVILDRQDKTQPITAEKEVFKLEYQRQKLLAEISQNNKEVQERLRQLAKETCLQIEHVRDNLARRRSEGVLDTVTERNFDEILKELRQEQVKALREYRAHIKQPENELAT